MSSVRCTCRWTLSFQWTNITDVAQQSNSRRYYPLTLLCCFHGNLYCVRGNVCAFNPCCWLLVWDTFSAQRVALEEEIAALLWKGAISMFPKVEARKGLFSLYFLVLQKLEGMRLILDPWQTDRCFHIPIMPSQEKYLCFVVGKVIYQYRCLPSGYSLAPCKFSKCVEMSLAMLWEKSVRTLTV